MKNIYRKLALAILSLPTISSAGVTLYTTSWSMYGNKYEYDGAYKNGQPYGQLSYVSNPDMVAQFNKADIVAWAFLQVWNSSDPHFTQYNIPKDWDGVMHFDDLWGELPYEASWVNPLPPETPNFLKFCKANVGACSSVQINGMTGVKELFNYTDQKGVGQLNSFGAFINSDKYTKAQRIISVGGANTTDNGSVSTYTYDAIFANQDKFLNQYSAWMANFKNLKGIDYDFEPPIDASGGQIAPNEKTTQDYKNLYNLVVATRNKLGKDAYISVTITPNKNYLAAIDESVDGGWFKSISPYVNSINLMTYDLHGPWDQSSDPLTSIHAYLKQPDTPNKDKFTINYGTEDIVAQVLSYGAPANKIEVGIAAYGRGFAGVPAGNNPKLPGFEQPWTGPSHFPEQYTNQDGIVPYKSIDSIIKDLGYVSYNVTFMDAQNVPVVDGSYIYNPNAKQFVGYQSPAAVSAICDFVKSQGLQGAIMWSADTDLPVSNPNSLLLTYDNGCNK